MPRAIVKNGVLHPVDPLPKAWKDGTEVRLLKVNKKTDKPGPNGSAKHPTDVWMDEVEKAAREIDAEGDRQFAQAIEEIRKEAKDLARRCYSFKKLMAGVTKSNLHGEIYTGPAGGKKKL